MSLLKYGRTAVLSLIACSLTLVSVDAEDLVLTDGSAFPGQLWSSQAGAPERSLHRRDATANPAFPNATMKIGAVAIGPDNKIYFNSGLDGCVIHLQDGRHEVLSFEFDGQIRDLACTGEEHTVYFSVVPTPQNNEALADGKIYRRDIWDGKPTEIATIHQADVGGNWWGTFTIRDGVIFIATLEDQSRVFQVKSSGPELAFTASAKIQGLTVGEDGSFYFSNGSDVIYRTADFSSVEELFRGQRPFTEIAVPAAVDSPGP
jgi:hypothetical protein